MPELLSLRGISKHFDGTQALRSVNLDVFSGEVHALVGENGAGKSTLGKIIAGVHTPDTGQIILNGAPVSLRDPLEAQRLGLGIIFQELDLFPNLTVADNIVIGSLAAEQGVFIDRKQMEEFCRPFLHEVGYEAPSNTLVADLSIAQMQLVAIARALSMNARVLVMDEPTSSLSEEGAASLFEVIGRLKRQGVAILYVSHKMNEIFRLADRITVLRDGEHVETKAAAETNVDDVIAMMVGREIKDPPMDANAGPGTFLLRMKAVSTRKLKGVSLDLHAGEVLGIAGLVGSGRSSIGAALFGLDEVQSGTVELKGSTYSATSPSGAIRSGFGLLPEDRKLSGLMMQMSCIENTTISTLDRMQRFRFVRQAEEREVSERLHRRLRLKAASSDAAVGTLSGGNQQKVLLARWLLVDPDVLFLDDPTRGIDIAAKVDIYEVIAELSRTGKGVLLVSSELPELLRLSHRIVVMREGSAVAILNRGEATQEAIMALATGGVVTH
ncbi:MAG: sugar ABC transporter ATP-binding protein [Bryobacteraceae bacterium]